MNMTNQNKNGVYRENGHIYSYIDGKRVSGDIKDGKRLVLTESTQQPNSTWVHSCGTPIISATVARAIWDTDKPTCRFCGFKTSIPLPDDLLLCYNCANYRTGNVLGVQTIDIPYCPNCERQPQTTLPIMVVPPQGDYIKMDWKPLLTKLKTKIE